MSIIDHETLENLSQELEKLLGTDFSNALLKLIEIRVQRYEQYGDSYLEDEYMFLYYQVANKAKRVRLQIDPTNLDKIINKEVALDSAIDSAVYSLFIASKLLKET